MPVCQFLEHQVADSDYTLSGLSDSTTQNVETPNKYSVDAKLFLKSLRASYPNNIIIGHLNINSLRNKFEILSSLIADTFDIFMLPKLKLDDTYTSAQFSIKRFSVPHRLDRNIKGGGILLYVRETLIVLPLKKYALPSNIEAMFFELNLRSKKWLFCYPYNSHKSLIKEHLKELFKAIQFYSKTYDNLMLIGDNNAQVDETNMSSFCETY